MANVFIDLHHGSKITSSETMDAFSGNFAFLKPNFNKQLYGFAWTDSLTNLFLLPRQLIRMLLCEIFKSDADY